MRKMGGIKILALAGVAGRSAAAPVLSLSINR